MVENIVRKRKEGMSAFAAAAAGTNEVFFAVISTTATLAAVFIPISFLPQFRPRAPFFFMIVIAGAVLGLRLLARRDTSRLARLPELGAVWRGGSARRAGARCQPSELPLDVTKS